MAWKYSRHGDVTVDDDDRRKLRMMYDIRRTTYKVNERGVRRGRTEKDDTNNDGTDDDLESCSGEEREGPLSALCLRVLLL